MGVTEMTSTGMARRVDDLGRIVLPAEMRRLLGIAPGDELVISVDGVAIQLTKLEQRCTFCGGQDQLRAYHEKQVCATCVLGLAPVPASAVE